MARYGGEEFAIILPSDNQQKAIAFAEKIRKSIEVLSCQAGRDKISLTVSIGVASIIPQLGSTEQCLIKMADKALYLAKDTGRNRVMEASSEQKSDFSYHI
ncbi:GGDEF domain-containing protein [Psychromonas sp. KJ10-10]|uniref:GGDEF domain-containing protein n=1 Tax=Psychromonas sp. KJ10-10 TaxID=3391823 RepID=UPI0039B36C56